MINTIIKRIKNEFGKPSNLWKKNKGITSKLNIDIGVVSHCNLNCRGCNHFSPIINEEFISIEEFTSDIQRLSEILDKQIGKIGLLGGEPLLHPQLIDFIRIGRNIFPDKEILIITNGLLLEKQKEEFWECCKKNNIEIKVTRYPINYDYSKIVKIGKLHSVNLSFYGRSKYVEKTLFKLPLDMEGKQDKESSFNNCYMGGRCITLYHGKLYPCSYAAYVGWFNKKFDKRLKVDADDYIDIYKEVEPEEILFKLRNPIPFCRYCDTCSNVYGEKWGTSKGNIEEWSTLDAKG